MFSMQGYNSKPLDKMNSENELRMRHPSGRETGPFMNNTKQCPFLIALKLIYIFLLFFSL